MDPLRTEPLDVHGDTIELLVAVPGQDTPSGARPSLLMVHGHQFPERPGARGAMPSRAVTRLTDAGWMVGGMSQPGYGGSTGPPDMCGPRTQAAVRFAFAHLLTLGADRSRTIVWGISRGAVACACAFTRQGPEPRLLIVQAGTYDMRAWVAWVQAGAPGGDLERASAILRNHRREAGLSRRALDERSGLLSAAQGSCDVLLVHGENDPQGPADDVRTMRDALLVAGRRVELVVENRAGHRLTGGFGLATARRHLPELSLP